LDKDPVTGQGFIKWAKRDDKGEPVGRACAIDLQVIRKKCRKRNPEAVYQWIQQNQENGGKFKAKWDASVELMKQARHNNKQQQQQQHKFLE
jgi:hypothetical protein